MRQDRQSEGLVTLRAPVAADAAMHMQFKPEPEIVRMYGGDPAVLPVASLERSAAWLSMLQGQPFGRVIEWDGEAVGKVRLHSLNYEDGSAKLAIGLFSGRFLGRRTGRRAISLALKHGFGAMQLQRITVRVLAINIRAIRCYTACGFQRDRIERRTLEVAGIWHDDWIMFIEANRFALAND